MKDCWFLSVYTKYSSTVEEYYKDISQLRVWLHTFITSDINEKLPAFESIMYMSATPAHSNNTEKDVSMSDIRYFYSKAAVTVQEKLC